MSFVHSKDIKKYILCGLALMENCRNAPVLGCVRCAAEQAQQDVHGLPGEILLVLPHVRKIGAARGQFIFVDAACAEIPSGKEA